MAPGRGSSAPTWWRPRKGLAGATGLVVCIAAAGWLALGTRDRGPAPDSRYPVLAIGTSAPDFSLPGIDGQTHSLADYASANVLAIVFTCNHCPVAQLYEARIEKLFEDYGSRGVAVVAINPHGTHSVRLDEQGYTDVGDSLYEMKIRADFRHLRYPYLYDGETQGAALKFGASAVPQMFVFDRTRKLRYEGRIDDNVDDARVTSPYARRAIEALLASDAVAVSATPPAGCVTRLGPGNDVAASEMAEIEAEPVTVSSAAAVDLEKWRANPTGQLLFVNFWATWCGPCIAEFADLQATYRMYRHRGLAMVTVSENDPAEREGVLAFLRKYHASTTNLLFASPDTSALQEAFDHNMSAAVPFSLLLAANGDVLYQEEGAVTLDRMRRAILANLPSATQYPGLDAHWAAE